MKGCKLFFLISLIFVTFIFASCEINGAATPDSGKNEQNSSQSEDNKGTEGTDPSEGNTPEHEGTDPSEGNSPEHEGTDPSENEYNSAVIWTGSCELDWNKGDNNGELISKDKFDSTVFALKFTFTTSTVEGSLKIMCQNNWQDRTMTSAKGDGYLVKDGNDTDKMVKLNSGKNSGTIVISYSPSIISEFCNYGIKFCGDSATITQVEILYKNSSDSSSELAPEFSEWTLVNYFNSSSLAAGWDKANWTNGSMFNCWWNPDNVTFNDNNNGLMTIKISENTNAAHVSDEKKMDYNGGELRTTATYGYGYYEVRMKPCKKSGTNTSFFLYTKDDNKNIPWNEIDIEFITRDNKTIPQFNYFVDNKGEGHEFVYEDISFDASEDFHVYGIEYMRDYIKWYVDGSLVYTATGCTVDNHNHSKNTLPSHNMQIMMNFWPGKEVDDWLGPFNYTEPLYAYYDYVKFKAVETN